MTTEKNTTEKIKPRAKLCNASNVILTLWDNTGDNLGKDDLEFISRIGAYARNELENIGENLENIACMVLEDENAVYFQGGNDVFILLSSVSHQVNMMCGLLALASNAQSTLDNWDAFKATQQKPVSKTCLISKNLPLIVA
ncbi:hypothetical protein [Methyloglobulus sp.]|uniref:hypothetical protein n=1 Tax=Methyloglobulus sp. TaxID=2518622 RepID=UPI003988EA26